MEGVTLQGEEWELDDIQVRKGEAYGVTLKGTCNPSRYKYRDRRLGIGCTHYEEVSILRCRQGAGAFKEFAGGVEQCRLSPVCWGLRLGPHKPPKDDGEVRVLDY